MKNFTKTILSIIAFVTAIVGYGQNITSVLIESWETGAWAQSAQSLYTYDGSGHPTSITTQSWNTGTLAWDNTARIVYVNNPDGTAATATTQTWTTDWTDAQRTTFTYTAFAEVQTSTSEIWTGTEWFPMSKTTNSYDASQWLVNELNQSWDFLGSAWANSTQTSYTNNASGFVTQSTTQDWLAGTSSWVNSLRDTYTYNGANHVTSSLEETWTGSSWVNSQLDTNTYDASGYLINALSQEWNTAGSNWTNSLQQMFTNNAQGKPVQVISQSWNGTAWENVSRITFTYAPLSVTNHNRNLLSVAPNPASENIVIRRGNLDEQTFYTIIDLSGRSITKGSLNAEETNVDINSLAPGYYLIQVGSTTLKLIKK